MQRGFGGAFGDVQALADLAIRNTLEQKAHDRPVAVSQGRLLRGVGAADGAEQRRETGGLEADFAAAHAPDGVAQDPGRVVFVQDTGHAGLNEPNRFLIADAGGDDESLAFETGIARPSQKIDRDCKK